MKANGFIPGLLLCIALLPAPAAAKEGYKVYLTAKENQGVPLREPATDFACADKIYGVMEIDRPGASGQHTLYATWRNPAGEDQEHTEYKFQVSNGHARIWVWLKLHRSTEASLVQFMNPSAGMEEFVGQWQIHFRVDDDTIVKKTFEVLC